jgi:hypothetical protein
LFKHLSLWCRRWRLGWRILRFYCYWFSWCLNCTWMLCYLPYWLRIRKSCTCLRSPWRNILLCWYVHYFYFLPLLWCELVSHFLSNPNHNLEDNQLQTVEIPYKNGLKVNIYSLILLYIENGNLYAGILLAIGIIGMISFGLSFAICYMKQKFKPE